MPFVPRTSVHSPSEMMNNRYWYSSDNIYYNGADLPNCTCYAYGRAAEILGGFTGIAGKLPMQDGGMWYAYTTGLRKVPAPNCVPELGCIMCFQGGVQGGHVAVVEQINRDSNNNIVSVVTSNSAYYRGSWTYDSVFPYWYTQTLSSDNNYGWQGSSGYYNLVGIIYLDGAGIQISDYVISAIAGVWNIESGLNPSIWENEFLPPTRWNTYYGDYGENTGGYGLGAWTNTRETYEGVVYDNPALLNMVNWCRSNGYYVDDTLGFVEPTGQLAYFLYNTGHWTVSRYAPFKYPTLNDFLSSTSQDINALVTEFFCNWESGGNLDPANSRWKVINRQYSAQIAYRYLTQDDGGHKNDNPENYNWWGVYVNGVPDNPDYINHITGIVPESASGSLSAFTYNNLMCMYFYLLQGYAPEPTPPTPPTTSHKMPLWMMLRYRRNFKLR